MAVQAPPADSPLTRNNVFTGMACVEFAPALAGGGFDAFRNLGLLQTLALQKALNIIQLFNTKSGVRVLDREEINQTEFSFAIGTAKFDPSNMQLMVGSATNVAVPAGAVAVTDEVVSVLASDRFSSLVNRNVTSITGITPRTVTAELVGSGDAGTSGETTGDFRLDFPIELVADITSITVGGTERVADLVSGSTPLTTEIAVVIGASATSGQLTFFTGESPTAGQAIVVTYTPSFDLADFTENTDYVLDPLNGGIRFLAAAQAGGASGKVATAAVDDSANSTGVARPAQQLDVDYSYNDFTRNDLAPFTQLVFQGRARISHLTNIGVNFIWDVPVASIRIDDTDLEWNSDDFAVGTLLLNVLNDSTSTTNPFGVWQHFPETPITP